MRIFAPLRHRPLALLWGALSLSAIGDQLSAVALAWIAVGVLGSAAGYLSAAKAFVLLLAVLGIGRWADRWPFRRSMMGADLARAGILLATVALALATGAPTVASLLAVIVVLALGEAVFEPALQASLPDLVPDRAQLPAANALLDATDRSARLIGPGLIALLAGLVPVLHFLTIDALTFLGSAAALLLIGRLVAPAPRHVTQDRDGLVESLARGVRAMASHPLLGFTLAGTGPINGAWTGVFYLGLPLMIERAHITEPGGSGLGAYGAVISAYGLTNVATTLLLGGRPIPARPQFQMFGGNLLVGIGMALLPAALLLPAPAQLPWLMASAALGAIGGPMKDIPLAVLRQTRLPRADLPAAVRAYMAASNAGMLVALAAIPSLVALARVGTIIVACGFVLIVLGGTGLVRYAGWREAEAAAE